MSGHGQPWRMPLVGEELAGYRLRSVLGRGGMSVVFEAEYLRLGNIVALKVLASELATDDVFRTRFLQESRMAASLNHPNVIPIFDSGPCGDLLYISMRYVAGADLRSVLKAHASLQADQALLLTGQAGRALDAAHRAGLVHRDVKPANILVERGVDADPDHVYLADFGISKHALSKSGLTSTGHFVGTLDYIAPEQIQGKAVSARTDIYSLGCVLYECLTGGPPFQKDIDAAVIWAHVEETPPLASSVRPDLPRAIDDVFARALAKQPGDRYESCRDFIGAARSALGLATAGARSPTTLDGTGEPPTVLDTALVMIPPADATATVAQPTPASDQRGSPPPPPRSSHPPGQTGSPPRRSDYLEDGHSPGETGAKSPRRYVPWAVAAAAIVALIVVLGVTHGGSSAHGSAKKPGGIMSTRPTSSRTAVRATSSNPIIQGIVAANDTPPKGYLPRSSCSVRSETEVVCNRPYLGANQVIIQTFPTLKALYSTYEARYIQRVGQPFRQNFRDCNAGSNNGEVSWNHDFQHTHKYKVAQLESGMLNDNLAVGRVFCTIRDGVLLDIVWTVNGGRMLGEVVGSPHEDTWTWWKNEHHSLGVGPNAMSMQ